MFGDSRPIDYSQLKVRGHYTKTEGLRRFFKGTMWLGNVIDLRIGAKPGTCCCCCPVYLLQLVTHSQPQPHKQSKHARQWPLSSCLQRQRTAL